MSSPDKPSNEALSCCTDTPETMSPKSSSSSPESGASDEFLEFEGTTTFAPAPSPTYRYSMTLKNGSLRIWLEDCESKKQWLASGLDQRDYVNSTNAIPNATASDYVEYFHQLLEGGYDDKNDAPITFQRHKEGFFRLEVTVKIQVLKQSRVATYAIDMESISLERVDVLESKMRDMKEEIKSLREEKAAATQVKDILDPRDKKISELKEQVKTLLQTQDCAEPTRLEGTARMGDWIVWGNPLNANVRVTNPGTYQVTAVVNHKARNTTASIQLFNGPECIQAANCGIGETTRTGEGSHSSTCLSCATRVEKYDELSVKCPVSLAGTSYLTLVRIGK